MHSPEHVNLLAWDYPLLHGGEKAETGALQVGMLAHEIDLEKYQDQEYLSVRTLYFHRAEECSKHDDWGPFPLQLSLVQYHSIGASL